MTVTTTESVSVARGNGATTSWPFNFKVLDDSHLLVQRRVYATGVVDKTYTASEMTIVRNTNDGTVTLTETLTDEQEIVIKRTVPYTQDTDIVNQGGFYPETVEERFDLLTMQVQQVKEETDRSMRVREGETPLTVGDIDAGEVGANVNGVFEGVANDAASVADQVALAEQHRNAAVLAALLATGTDFGTAVETVVAILNAANQTAPFNSCAADGWQLDVDTPVDPPALTEFDNLRIGYTSGLSATLIKRTGYLGKQLREVFPNEDDLDPDTVAATEELYSSDMVFGATISSLLTSPKPVAAWVMADRQRINATLDWELVAFHKDAKPDSTGVGRMVAGVRVRANDGTTATDWQTVSATVQSTYCDDANAPEVYKGTLDTSGLADGAVWLEAEVYPHFGEAASVLKSEDNYSAGIGQRGFTRRWFRKTSAATQYVAVASTGNDSTGVVSTTEATAIATPCLTVAGAQKKAHDILGTSDGALDVVDIVIVDGVDLGTVTFTGSYKQDIAAVRVTRATGTTRAAAVVTTTANYFPDFDSHTIALDEGALMFEDMSLTFGGVHTINGATGVPLHIIIKDCNVDMGSNATPIRSSDLSHVSWFGCTFSNMPASSNNAVGFTTAGETRILRGCTVNMGGQAMEGWITIGCDITDSKGQGYLDYTEGCIFYNNKYLSPDSTTSGIIFDTTTELGMGPVVIVQNLVEWTSATAQPAIRVSADNGKGSMNHVVFAHNCCPGAETAGRWNLFYDDTTGTDRTFKHIMFKGNLGASLNTKGDVFKSDGTKIGNFNFHHGVGCEGNYTIDADANGGSNLSFKQAYAGRGSLIDNGDPLFTNNQATTGTAGGGYSAGAGGGDYTLQSGSPARDILSEPLLAFDLAGNSRGTGTQDAGCYA